MTMPPGAIPSGSVTGTSVGLSWSATTTPPADGYVVQAFDAATDTPRAVGSGCSGVVGATSCTETGAPDGTWYYTVTPALHTWRGAPSTPGTAVTVEARDPVPTAVHLVNGDHGTAGIVDANEDQVAISFSEPLSVASICNDWTDDALDQSLTGAEVVVHLTDVAGTTNLTATTTGVGQCTLHLGTVDLGADYLGSSSATFTNSRVAWSVASRKLVVTFGDLDTGTLASTPVSAATATFTPDGAITDRFGHAVVTTPITTTGQRC
jgi:hypothetical protein